MIRISQLKVSLLEEEHCLKDKIRSKLKLKKGTSFTYHIYRKNIDARDHKMIYFVYTVDVLIEHEERILAKHLQNVMKTPQSDTSTFTKGTTKMNDRPVVVGFGPAGIFASLLLAQNGYCPIIFERGEDVDCRSKRVQTFFKTGMLDEESNIQFGEGGAGTFSDGKLTARSKDVRVQKVYDTLVSFGAPIEITYESLPHIGSNRLQGIIKKIREEIISLGGEIHFSSKIEQLCVKNGQICGIVYNGITLQSNHVVLALGNSARDTLIDFHKQGLAMESKPFAIGLRIEHKQSMINRALYHDFHTHPSLSSASYFLSNHKGVYTFCMCPGGSVVAATSLKEHVVVNGMSQYERNFENANSAILVSVDTSHYGEGIFDGMQWIDELERKAYILGGSNYQAPAQLVQDFLQDKASVAIKNITPSYPLGVRLCNLQSLLPSDITIKLKEGLYTFATKIEGFINEDAILTGIETRSSSPIRILRDQETLQSISVKGVYPCGEGSGYSGGIVSSAIDGMKCAEKIINEYIWEESYEKNYSRV